MPAVAEWVLLSSHCLPRLLVPPSAGDLSQLMLLNYKTGLVIKIISRDCNKRGEFWLVSWASTGKGCRVRCNALLDCTARLGVRDRLMHFILARAKSCLLWAARLRTAGKRATAGAQSREHLPSSHGCTGACGHPRPRTPGCLLGCPSSLRASRRSLSFQAVPKPLLLMSFLM